IWGLFPVRVAFGLILVLETTGPMYPAAVLIALFVIMGFLGRVVGAVMVMVAISMLFTSGIATTDIFIFAISVMLLMSGPGRFSVDRWIARRILERYPNPKKELYVIAETPYTDRWYE
ncbi:MAG: TQO small subunit DoxD, partial [Candidatus Uhrbacteria bacterium]